MEGWTSYLFMLVEYKQLNMLIDKPHFNKEEANYGDSQR